MALFDWSYIISY